MYRNSAATRELVDRLTAAKLTLNDRTVTGRIIERLSHEQLLRPEENPEQTLGRFRELAAIGYGTGKSASRAALVLTTRGFPCERVRTAILEPYGLNPESVARLDQDSIARMIEVALEHGVTPEGLAQPTVEAWRRSPIGAVGDQVAKVLATGGRTDWAGALLGPLTEDPEQRSQLLGRTAAEAAMGREITDPTPILDLMGLFGDAPAKPTTNVDYDVDGTVQDFMGEVASWAPAYFPIVTSAPLDELSTAAQKMRSRLALVPFLGHLLAALAGTDQSPAEADGERLDALAAQWAPVQIIFDRRQATT